MSAFVSGKMELRVQLNAGSCFFFLAEGGVLVFQGLRRSIHFFFMLHAGSKL